MESNKKKNNMSNEIIDFCLLLNNNHFSFTVNIFDYILKRSFPREKKLQFLIKALPPGT